MAIIFSHDFEDNSLATYDANEGTGSATIQGTTVHGGVLALRCQQTTQQKRLRKNFTATATAALDVWWRRASSEDNLFHFSLAIGDDSNSVGVRYNSGNINLMTVIASSETQQDAVSNTVDTWQHIEIKANLSANPWVLGWRVDGNDRGTFSPAATSNSFDHYYQGSWVFDNTSDVYIDDVQVSDAYAYIADTGDAPTLRVNRSSLRW